MKSSRTLVAKILSTILLAALPIMAKSQGIFSDAQQLGLVTVTASRCSMVPFDTFVTVVFGCPGFPMSPAAYLYSTVLPAVTSSTSLNMTQKAGIVAKAYKPCVIPGESATDFKNRNKNACINSVVKNVTGADANVGLMACNPLIPDWVVNASNGDYPNCS